MKTYKRPSKAQITAIALTMMAVGGGSYGVMSAANNAAAQTPNQQINSASAYEKADVKETDAEEKDDIKDNESDDANEPALNGSVQVTDNDKDDSKKDTPESEADEAAQYAGLATITEAQAIKAAEAKVGGTATKAELGNEDGSLIYEVNVNGKEVKVDAGNGTVLQVEADDDESGENEADDEESDGIDHDFEGEEEHAD